MATSRFNAFLTLGKTILAGSLLAGCATDPSRITAAAYDAPCTSSDRSRLATITKEQKAMARNDALGVILVGLPLGSMGRHDYKDEIARLKGSCG